MKKVSIIIPSYNHADYIEQTIRSVFLQNYKNMEVLVIDDGSKDKSPEIIEKLSEEFNFKFVLKKNEGLCKTLNLGLEQVTGDFILILASDDTLTKNRVSEQVSVLESSPDIDVVSGSINLIDNEGLYLFTKHSSTNGLVSFNDLLRRNFIMAPTCMIRHNVYEKYGKYNEHYKFEDYYLWLRILSNGGRILVTKNVWANYRYMSGDMTGRIESYYQGVKQILSDYLPNPTAEATIKRARFIYCVKSTLFSGKKFIRKEHSEILMLSFFYRNLVKVISFFPNGLRQFIFKRIISRL